jgi:hypothetical protein
MIFVCLDHGSPATVIMGPQQFSGDAAPSSWIDVSNVVPQPGVGWMFDGTTWTQPVREANQDALTAKAIAAVTTNVAYLALAPPTVAQIGAQVRSLTQQVNALIRLVTDQLDSSGGT